MKTDFEARVAEEKLKALLASSQFSRLSEVELGERVNAIAKLFEEHNIKGDERRKMLELIRDDIDAKEKKLLKAKDELNFLVQGYKSRTSIGMPLHKEFGANILRRLKLPSTSTPEQLQDAIYPFLLSMSGLRKDGEVETVAEFFAQKKAATESEEEAANAAVAFMGKMMPFTIGSALWAQSGFPEFDLTSDFFHSIAATDFGDAGNEVFHLPFRAIAIKLPENELMYGCRCIFLFEFELKDEKDGTDVPQMQVGKEGNQVQIIFGIPRKDMDWVVASGMWPKDQSLFDSNFSPVAVGDVGNAQAAATLETARRVILNTLVYINSNNGLPPKGAKKVGPDVPVERDHKELPRFRVGRPIKLGPTLKKLLHQRSPSSETRSLMQRYMVRGHWRNQAHGPLMTLRKRMWIEPYWKGPEDMTEALKRTYEVT